MSKSKPSNGTGKPIDWAAIKADYLEGRPVRAIAQDHGISASSIYRRARSALWPKDQSADSPPFTDQRVTREIAGNPRGELAQLRDLAAKLRLRLENHIDGRPPNGGALIGVRESPAALLLKLCQITEKIIHMESRMAAPDAPTASKLKEQDHEILERFKRRAGLFQ